MSTNAAGHPTGGHGHSGSVSWPEARAIALRAAPAWPVAEVPLPMAYGCRLARPLRALAAVPGVDVSAMDGYALAGEQGPWRVVGRVLAGGHAHAEVLKPGCAVEIATGARVPEGATAVLPYEAAVETPAPPRDTAPGKGSAAVRTSAVSGDGGEAPPDREAAGPEASREAEVLVHGVVEEGRHIRRRGEDVGLDEVVLAAGTTVTPAVLGLAAALGHDVLAVHRRPEVAVLVTGDEVVDEGLPEPGRVRDAIGPFLPGLVEWAGGRTGARLRLPDGVAPLQAALRRHPEAAGGGQVGGAGEAEVIVVCGASSKGPADHLRAVLDELGADVLVDGVAVRPGHPQLLARLPGGRLVVGLPGNPFAALAAALTLLVPVLKGERYEPGERTTLAGTAKEGLRARGLAHHKDTRLVPVRRSGKGAVPVGHDRPGSLWGAALADALAVIPPRWDGEPVELLDLPD